MSWALKRADIILSLALAAVTLALAAFTTFPWCDELVLAGDPARWAVAGSFDGRVWPCIYNLLYPLALSGWFKVFGVSHLATISLSTLAAFLASCLCLRVARRRGLFGGLLPSLAFVVLFWCGHGLNWMVTDGRLDALTMLFAVLFADALLPDPGRREGRRTVLMTAVWAFLLMLTSVYMLPVLFVLGLLVLIADPLHDRAVIWRKGFAATAAIVVGYALIAGFYFLQANLIRFCGFYLYFNTITGLKAEPMAIRLVKGYLFNREALALAFVVLAAMPFSRRSRPNGLVAALGFTLAIPLVMTLGGRYEHYYSWAFYVPLSLLAVCVLGSCRFSRWLCLALVLAWGGFAVCSQTELVRESGLARSHAVACDDFVRAHPEVFRPGHEIVVAEDVTGDGAFFYPVLRSGARPWFRGVETLTAPSDEEKFDAGLAMLVPDAEKRRRMLAAVAGLQSYMPTLPDDGFVVFPSAESRERVEPLLRERGCELETIAETPFALARMARKSRLKPGQTANGHASVRKGR